jgi:hypothetical protein
MNNKVKLTEEQQNLITSVLDDTYGDDDIFDADTEKWESFKAHLLENDEPEQIDALIDMCKEYNEERKTAECPITSLGFIMMYDMWINESSVWPVMYKPEWEKEGK